MNEKSPKNKAIETKFKKLPMIPSSKITVGNNNVKKQNNQKLPNLTMTPKKNLINPATNRFLNHNLPASPPTSRQISLENMLFGDNPAEVDPNLIEMKNYETTKISSKKNGPIKSYAANTNQGILRDYNEDRVSIILNVAKPDWKRNITNWPKISFFGVFDGHGGHSWPDFLRDYLHTFIVKDQSFPQFPKIAIKNGFKEAE